MKDHMNIASVYMGYSMQLNSVLVTDSYAQTSCEQYNLFSLSHNGNRFVNLKLFNTDLLVTPSLGVIVTFVWPLQELPQPMTAHFMCHTASMC